MKKFWKLYRHYDEQDILLYVGITMSLFERIYNHTSQSFWFDFVAKITVEKYSTKKSVLKHERRAIKHEKPIFNRQFNSGKMAENYLITRGQFNKKNKEMTDLEVCVYTGIGKRTLYRMISDKRFPVEPIKGTNPRRWSIESIDLWLASGGVVE